MKATDRPAVVAAALSMCFDAILDAELRSLRRHFRMILYVSI